MTDQPDPSSAVSLRALIKKWREQSRDAAKYGVRNALCSHREYFGSVNAAWTLWDCAEELESLLAAAVPGSAPVKHEPYCQMLQPSLLMAGDGPNRCTCQPGSVRPPQPEIERWRQDSEVLRHCNIIEIAVRNETGSVSDYMNHWEGRALKAEAELEKLAARPNESWAVTVERNGEQVVTLSTYCLSGRDLGPDDERVVRTAAENLLAFVGGGCPGGLR